jgi:L-methionine (R)-S-oxide reductase
MKPMLTATPKTQQVKKEIDQLATAALTPEELMQGIVKKLNERMLKYNWAGFYLLENKPGQMAELVLGPYVGAMTPHTRIPLNKGICGAAASTGKTQVVHDVKSDPRYLACSIETKSEIVVPVFVHGKVVGELDIDSHFPAAFKPEDQELVEYCARVLGKHLEKFRP